MLAVAEVRLEDCEVAICSEIYYLVHVWINSCFCICQYTCVLDLID